MGSQESSASTVTVDSGTLTPADVAELPIVPHSVYACLSERVYEDPTARSIPNGWTELVSCVEPRLNREGYYAVAYINERIRHCIIAERGTYDPSSVRAGVWVYFDEPTIQFVLAEQFSRYVRLRLHLTREHGGAAPYVVSYTGHSLGAVLAACRACAEHTFAVTFESPGARRFVEKTMHPFTAGDVDVVTYQRPPNPINTLRPQCGYLLQITHPLPTHPSFVGPTEAQKRSPLSIPNVQEFLRSKMMPEVHQTLAAVEPVVRELLGTTQQYHSMSGIVAAFEEQEEVEGAAKDVILVWPANVFQFWEVYSATKLLDEDKAMSSQAHEAFSRLVKRLYVVKPRSAMEMPLRYISKASQALVNVWWSPPLERRRRIPLRPVEQRALNSTRIEDEKLQSTVVTALQMKMLLAVIVSRPDVRQAIDVLSESGDIQAKL